MGSGGGRDLEKKQKQDVKKEKRDQHKVQTYRKTRTWERVVRRTYITATDKKSGENDGNQLISRRKNL